MTPSKNPVLHAKAFVPAWVTTAYAAAFAARLWAFEVVPTDLVKKQTAYFVGAGLLLIVGALVHQRAEFGAEGIRIGWLFWKRRIAYSDIRRAVPNAPKKVTVVAVDGSAYELSAGYLDEASARDVLERVWHALAAGAQEGARGLERETLARSGRTTPEWRKALRELGAPSGYRSAQFSSDRLVAIAENPGIAAELRTAAVVALSAGELDARVRDRLRAAGSVTVDPALRALLGQLATPDAALDEHACDVALERA